MSRLIPGNQKHLSLTDRQYIETSLNNHVSFQDIARYLCKDPTTISKEVKKYRLSDFCTGNGLFYNEKNHCIHRFKCTLVNVCHKILDCNVKCRSCPTCNQTCSRFERERCLKIDHAPYVCNGCPDFRKRCPIAQKYHYDAFFADRKYHEQLVSARAGIAITRQELHKVDAVITPLIDQGQSPYQIICNHPELDMSVRTLYNYIDRGILCARNIDLKRKVRFKPRKVHKTQIHDRTVFINRMYADFESLGLDKWVEMDTVHSRRPCKRVLLTFFFTKEKLFLAYILDRGSEFANPDSLEIGVDGIMRTSIYYCDPMRSGQKGAIEQAHTMLRNVLPKESDFGFLTQWDVNLIVNHMNSTPRESLGGRTPYAVALETYGEEALKKLQLKLIEPDKVNLTPELIRFTK